jgi:hypothetical protein
MVEVRSPDGLTDTLYEVEALAFEDDLIQLAAQALPSDPAPADTTFDAAASNHGGSGAIGLNDAVAILKMIAGRADAAHAADIRQSVAADFDADGIVGLGDALGVLRHAVGLQAATPAWVTFDPADPALATRPALQPGRIWAADVLAQDLLPAGVELVSVMRGDVDGSLLRSAYGVYEG